MTVQEMPVPTYVIHNQTSALFVQNGISAIVHLPEGPSIDLPFKTPMTFMQVMKYRMQDNPNCVGQIMKVEAENSVLSKAVELIRLAGESDDLT